MILSILATAFAADTFVLIGSENRLSADGVLPRAKAIVDVPVAEKLSVTATFVVSTNYAEAYIGPTWTPSRSFSFGVAGGIELADDPWRAAAFASARHKSLHWLAVAEYGGTGLWYKALASYSVCPIVRAVVF